MPIPWESNKPVWVPQWPLSQEKLEAANDLVLEQLRLGHVEPSVSPWNTPIFVIKKSSGKWRLLHDLRAVNAQMQVMGAVQRGLPLLSALPRGWPVMALDIKDCFFSIPLHPDDRERFAFTLPSVNHEQPDARYQWKMLPQGMANSATICQLYVAQALLPVRQQFPKIRIINYMDDVLLAASSQEMLLAAFQETASALRRWGLVLAPDKIQQTTAIKFLGAIISPLTVTPQKISIRTHHLRTLNDFQQLLGDINWIRGYLNIPRATLLPLFSILEGDPNVNSNRTLTPLAEKALKQVEKAMSEAQLCRVDPALPIFLCILKTAHYPTGVLWQNGPLWWIHGNSSGTKAILYYPELVASQAILGIKHCLTSFATMPDKLIIPYTKGQVETLAATVNEWAVLVCAFSNLIDNHYPRHPLLNFVERNLVYFPKVTFKRPIDMALTVFTDGSKTGRGAIVIQGKDPILLDFRPDSPQVTECMTVLEVFKRFSESFNLFSDSNYVVNAVASLEVAAFVRNSSTVSNILCQIQACILQRDNPFFIGHIRAHTLLPGPMAEANNLADCLTRSMALVASDPVELARDFHKLWHVPANTLRKKFHISRQIAREIVKACSSCVTFLHPPKVGVNPRGLQPNALWQMDVTHVPEFGKLKYLHVSVDTFSGIIHATPLAGEKVTHVKTHCLEAWAAWGKPLRLKTDNGPAYTSHGFRAFCAQLQVTHITGLPYNPQGQGIVERANRNIKEILQKQKGGIAESASPRERISLVLFTLNFLNLNESGTAAAEKHAAGPMEQKDYVMWKDVLDNQWYGPDLVVARSRGAVCVFPQGQEAPLWVPSRLTRMIKEVPKDEAESLEEDSADIPDDVDPGEGGAQKGNPVCLPIGDACSA